MMTDREKVIKAAEICLRYIDDGDCPTECPYFDLCTQYEKRVVFQPLIRDALALLKEDCHKCKLECLLQKYDQLKEKYDKLLKEQTDEIKELRSMVEFWKEKALHT